MYWTTRSGKKIKIIEIEDQHLLNIITFVKRNAVKRYLNNMISVLKGDQPLTLPKHLSPFSKYLSGTGIYSQLVSEARRRKLFLENNEKHFDYMCNSL